MAGFHPLADRREHAESLNDAARARRLGMKGCASHFVAKAREERQRAVWSHPELRFAA